MKASLQVFQSGGNYREWVETKRREERRKSGSRVDKPYTFDERVKYEKVVNFLSQLMNI